jgi:hypothetical protein
MDQGQAHVPRPIWHILTKCLLQVPRALWAALPVASALALVAVRPVSMTCAQTVLSLP